jgi:hypothetical protein
VRLFLGSGDRNDAVRLGGLSPITRKSFRNRFLQKRRCSEKDFEAALKRVAVFSDTFQKVRIAFDVKGKHLTFFTECRRWGIGRRYGGAYRRIDRAFFQSSLSRRPTPLIAAENLSVSASGIGTPARHRGAGDASFLYLVMPMNQ